jgi:hypothetical protein
VNRSDVEETVNMGTAVVPNLDSIRCSSGLKPSTLPTMRNSSDRKQLTAI